MSVHRNTLRRATVGHLRPQSLASTASNQTTGLWERAGKCRAYIAFCHVGALDSGTATFQIYGASDADGGAAAIVGAALVVSTAGGGGEIELPVGLINPLKPYISVVCTTAAGTGICGALLYMAEPSYTAA